MEIVLNAFVDQSGAYYPSGGLVVGSQRIPSDHSMEYWQQANVETSMAKTMEVLNASPIPIKEALYVGRIPTHFGHFLMEGFPRLCDAVHMDMPIIGYITDGFLPEGIKATPQSEIRWFIGAVTSAKFIEVDKDETYRVDRLFVSGLPIKLSHSCAEPWRMTAAIRKVVKKARGKGARSKMDLYLMRLNEDLNELTEHADGYVLSDPASSISEQIAMVSRASKLLGITGSNTHLSMFASGNCQTHWLSRGDVHQGDRNQLICDLVRTYNDFN